MCLQTRIIKEYRELFPRYTLRETSAQTGIQLTRIFRIYNGAPMKLGEYELFHEIVHGATASTGLDGPFRRVTEALARSLSRKDLDRVTAHLDRQFQWHQIIHSGKSYEKYETSVIA